jgi:hypothetical protein
MHHRTLIWIPRAEPPADYVCIGTSLKMPKNRRDGVNGPISIIVAPQNELCFIVLESFARQAIPRLVHRKPSAGQQAEWNIVHAVVYAEKCFVGWPIASRHCDDYLDRLWFRGIRDGQLSQRPPPKIVRIALVTPL